MNRVQWPVLLRFGLAELRLMPETFWSLTPAELMVMAGQAGAGQAMSRAGLDALIARFPDSNSKEDTDDGS
ncbi:MAG: rcc01693 family protein [Pseudomonadota bacterium]